MAKKKPTPADEYELRLAEVKARFGANSVPIQVRVPTFLHKRWKAEKARGLKSHLSDLVSRALHFGLFGPHPFDDPVEGLDDAYRVYVEQSRTEREIMSDIIRMMAAKYSIDLKSL